MLSGNVLITGGTGFLARAIYARADRENWPVQFTCFSRDDAKQAVIAKRFPEVLTIRGDVTQPVEELRGIFAGHDVVIHAAAAKYVDRSEAAAFDTVRVNIDGSRNVFRAAAVAGVENVIAISTDKACQPANVYGMTKAVMERLALEAAHDWVTDTQYSVCRYGNVIGSTGSIVPIFREQAKSGTITVTDPKMTRFWMPVGEAIDLIEYAKAHPGVVAIPRPRAMQIGDIADAIARAHEGPVWIETVGIRPGEKRHETLVSDEEMARTTENGPGEPVYYQLHAPGWKRGVSEALAGAFTSQVPPGGWMEPDEFMQHAVAAEAV